jgi:hypothetical protein
VLLLVRVIHSGEKNMKTLVAGALALLVSFTSASSASADCGSYLHAGGTYNNRHVNTQGLSFDGQFTLRKTYACAEGTCFTGTIRFPAFNNGTAEFVAGYWSGNSFKLRRYVDIYSYVQTWTGGCGPRGLTGTWTIDPEAFNHGNFTMGY